MNQNPEQLARDKIDEQLILSGWLIQNKNQINLAAAPGIAIREYGTLLAPPIMFSSENLESALGSFREIIAQLKK